MAPITINGVTLDPEADQPALRTASLDTADTSATNYVLVQADHVLADAERADLEKAGAVIQEYVGTDTYLCSFKPADLTPIRQLGFVRWANAYLEGFKVPPALRHPAQETMAVTELAQAVPRTRALQEIDIVLHPDVSADNDNLRARLAAAAHLAPSALSAGRNKYRAYVQQGYIPALAANDEVRQIEPVPTRQLRNNVAGPIMAASIVVNGGPYQGDGQVVGVADTGLDKGSVDDVHPAFAGRVAKLYALGRSNPDLTDDPDGHGTHVAGSVLGDGHSDTMGGAIQGTAPKATLVLQSLLDANGGLGGIPADLHDLFLPPYQDDGVRVHTNSWGSTTPGLPYDQSATEIDDVVWNNPDLAICFAAGNDGADPNGHGTIDPGSVGSEAAAKNCITVGASESNRPDIAITYASIRPASFPADPIKSDLMADNPDGMAGFSSRGPTQEGRFKPDVCAPGTSILSTLSRAVATPSTTFGTSSDPAFFFDTGTSMATPLTAGCVAVLRGALLATGTTPSAALLKALLITGAVELVGQYNPSEAGPSPNDNSGWGRINLAAAFLTPGDSAGFGDGAGLNQGESSSIDVTIPDGVSTALTVTLVWTDPAGAVLQNDLDLTVRTSDGQERHGNMGTGTDFDRVNNVEQVVWTDVPGGAASIVISAFRITTGPQPYAYAWRIG